jgi:hypothetical protein
MALVRYSLSARLSDSTMTIHWQVFQANILAYPQTTFLNFSFPISLFLLISPASPLHHFTMVHSIPTVSSLADGLIKLKKR